MIAWESSVIEKVEQDTKAKSLPYDTTPQPASTVHITFLNGVDSKAVMTVTKL